MGGERVIDTSTCLSPTLSIDLTLNPFLIGWGG
jgi:hypothetical protein